MKVEDIKFLFKYYTDNDASNNEKIYLDFLERIISYHFKYIHKLMRIISFINLDKSHKEINEMRIVKFKPDGHKVREHGSIKLAARDDDERFKGILMSIKKNKIYDRHKYKFKEKKNGK